ncbi:hypothetical protein [Salisaeta longa]|uniref:hypothetical protein n=1 Tax=Salisaeta longa TaxID=503170 RepID=UPI0003B4A664|nr:hypothetical protein [Salisaeta longa]
MRNRLAACGLLLCGALLVAFVAVEARAVKPSPSTDVARALLVRDTLQRSVDAGRTLVLELPHTLQRGAVRGYTIDEAPMMAGLAGFSFTWITRPSDVGTHTIRLHAHYPSAPADTLALTVTITP